MKATIQQKKKTTKVPRDFRSSISITGAHKFRKTGGQGHKLTGRASGFNSLRVLLEEFFDLRLRTLVSFYMLSLI